jgi:hypothetical protein
MTFQPSPRAVASKRSPHPRGRRVRIAGGVVLIAALAAGAVVGLDLYRKFGPVPMCAKIPVLGQPMARVILPSDPEAQAFLGSKAGLACPEAPRSFTQWYVIRVFFDRYFVDANFETREADQDWGYAGLMVHEADSLRPIFADFSFGKEIQWPARGCNARMLTAGPDRQPRTSYVRQVLDGPHAGDFEADLVTEKSRLHLFLHPLTPGVFPGQVCLDVTRPGSWLQYYCVFMMASVSGTIELADGKGNWTTHDLPGPSARPAYAYLEHMWGQTDRPDPKVLTRQYWDWATIGDPRGNAALMFGQSDSPDSEIGAFTVLSLGREQGWAAANRPPEQFARVAYSRLALDRGALYPQEIKVWARFSPDGFVNLQGFSRGQYFDWQAFDFWGRAGEGEHRLDWSKGPVWSVVDFYKGSQVRTHEPEPARGLRTACGGEGCQLSWLAPGNARGSREYWIFRHASPSRYEDGVPIGVVEFPPPVAAGATAELTFRDPQGQPDTVYHVTAADVPATLLHQRVQAGYARCSRPPTPTGPPAPAPPELARALDPEGACQNVRAADDEAFVGREADDGKIHLWLAKDDASGALEFHFHPSGGNDTRALKPRLGPTAQLQSFTALRLDDKHVALAWSERLPIMGDGPCTDGEVFLSVTDLETGAFVVLPVSMSDPDSVNASLESDGDRLTVSWIECADGQCTPVHQEYPLPLAP